MPKTTHAYLHTYLHPSSGNLLFSRYFRYYTTSSNLELLQIQDRMTKDRSDFQDQPDQSSLGYYPPPIDVTGRDQRWDAATRTFRDAQYHDLEDREEYEPPLSFNVSWRSKLSEEHFRSQSPDFGSVTAETRNKKVRDMGAIHAFEGRYFF